MSSRFAPCVSLFARSVPFVSSLPSKISRIFLTGTFVGECSLAFNSRTVMLAASRLSSLRVVLPCVTLMLINVGGGVIIVEDAPKPLFLLSASASPVVVLLAAMR